MPSADAACLPTPDASPWLSQGASLTLHVGVMVLLAFLVPPAMPDGETSEEDVEWIRHVLASTGKGDDDGIGSTRASPEDGTAREDRNRERGSEGESGFNPPPSSSPSIPVHPSDGRAAAVEEAAAFGMIGLLADPSVVDPNAPPSPWARGEASGSPRGGALWGDAIGDGFGFGGVALSGIGEGGGGRGEGIEIGDIGTLGCRDAMSTGEGFGCGCGRGRIGGSHQTRAPAIRCGPPSDAPPGQRDGGCTATVYGRLPPETVQRVVRQSFGRFRLCYEDGLRRDPGLEGRVSVKFVIDRQGAVAMAADAGSDLTDESVVSCVVRGFHALSFPQPEGGIVTVIYPLVLSRTDAP